MRVDTIKLYPTPKECQYQDGGNVPVRAFIAYLEQIVKRWPTDQEEAGAFVKVGTLEVHIPHAVTDTEIMAEKLEDTRKTLQNLLDLYDVDERLRADLLALKARL